MVSDEDATYLFAVNPPRLRPTAHGAAAAAPPSPTPTPVCHRDIEHLGWTGIWDGTGHPGISVRRFQHDEIYQDEDLHDGILLEPSRIQGNLLVDVVDLVSSKIVLG